MNARRRDFFTFDRSVTPVLLFVVLYLGFAAATGSVIPHSILAVPWLGLASALISTAVMMALYDRRFLDLGLVQHPILALGQLSLGLFLAVSLALAADILMILSGATIHAPAGQINMTEMLLLFVPAVLHEELVFRGYPFQKLLSCSPVFAVLSGSAAFAAAHLGNRSWSYLAVLNVFLAGLVLSLLLVLSGSLWTPIGFHFGWNFTTGPVLGHEVSGYAPKGTLLSAVDRGSELFSGGNFGMEASICATLVQIAALLLLAFRINQNRRGNTAVDTVVTGETT